MKSAGSEMRRRTCPEKALMTTGQLEDAIASYRKSLELNPANGNVVEMIEKIEHMG